MQAQTDRMKPFTQWLELFRTLPLVLISLFIMVGVVDVLLALQPGILQSVRGSWQDWTLQQGISTPWARLMAAAVSVAGVSIASAILATFLRGVQSEPFAWLAPAWVGLLAFVLARMPIVLPLPASTPLFASASGLAILGGATFLQQRSLLRTLTATFLILTPIALLCVGYLGQFDAGVATPRFDAAAGLAMFVLVLTAIGAALIAVNSSAGAQAGAGAPSELGEQMFELLERVKFSEMRASQAEQQLQQLRATSSPSGDDFARIRPHAVRQWQLWAALAFVMGCGASLYFASYVPLRGRLSAELARSRRQAEQQAQTLSSLRAHFAEERATFSQQLRAAHPQPAAEPSVTPAAPPSQRSEPAKPQAQSHRSSARVSRRTQREPASPEPATANDSAPAEASERTAPARKPVANPAGNSSSNDPLEGLDGM
jgi:hypothetical protein